MTVYYISFGMKLCISQFNDKHNIQNYSMYCCLCLNIFKLQKWMT